MISKESTVINNQLKEARATLLPKKNQVRLAASEYSKGNYESALETYKYLAETIGQKFFDANILLCERRLQGIEVGANFAKNIVTPHLNLTNSRSAGAPSITSVKPTKRLRSISIMDEISEECWRYEMTSYPISRKNYTEQIDKSVSDFCFLESCWKGNRGTWEYAFTSPGLKHANAQALLDAIVKVKKKMPIIFWNKEDPMHYDRYLPIAKHADIIFTTDANKVADYQRDIPSAQVHAVPFAAQQRICNPSDRFRTTPESVCFAGSYYGVGHDERKRQMDALLPSIIEFNGAIYDRMSKIDGDRYAFPPQYTPFIRDAVPFTEVVKLYKRFKVFLNVNTIIDSPTMMSRRVYELLACGTPVVSTPSKAIEEQFAGIVHVAKDADEANVIIEKLLTDEHFWEKSSHIGYREVMKKHTYSHRLQDIQKSLGQVADDSAPLISIITCTRRPNMIDRIVENMTRQNHPNCELILVLQDFNEQQRVELVSKLKATPSNIKRVEVIVNDSQDVTLGERFNDAAAYAEGEYIAKMDDDDLYFKNYLSDMIIPFSFGDYGLVGKKELFMYLSGSSKLIKRFPGVKHCEADFVAGATFVFKASVFHKYKFQSLNRGEDSDLIGRLKKDGIKIYASDPFNFIVWRGATSAHTWDATDEYFLSGKQTEVIADNLDTSVCDF
ncbi:glycosyltransferase [Pseudomonas sp. SAS7]|uniref:glycosyltransferase family protein n=1 Tax=Pseudomonas sp. SAS7 TaxID=3156487 RepID=UPI003F96115F